MDKENITKDGDIKLTDLPMAVTLVTLGATLLDIRQDPSDYYRLNFIFENSDTVEKIMAGYWNGNLLVEPKAFWNVSREIKSRIRFIK